MQYIKAPRALADFLGLLHSRSMLADGSYLLWDRDILRLAGSGTLEALVPQIGCIILSAPDVRKEQEGEGQPAELPDVTLPALLQFMQENNYPLPSIPEEEPSSSEQLAISNYQLSIKKT